MLEGRGQPSTRQCTSQKSRRRRYLPRTDRRHRYRSSWIKRSCSRTRTRSLAKLALHIGHDLAASNRLSPPRLVLTGGSFFPLLKTFLAWCWCKPGLMESRVLPMALAFELAFGLSNRVRSPRAIVGCSLRALGSMRGANCVTPGTSTLAAFFCQSDRPRNDP